MSISPTQTQLRPENLPTQTVPRHPTRVLLIGAAVGIILAVIWSARFVDQVIGSGIADTALGENAKEITLSSSGLAILFAFVSGVAGSFTACNVAVFSSLAPIGGQTMSTERKLVGAIRLVGWVALGMLVVSATYGAIAAAVGPGAYQLSQATVGHGFPVRLIQASVVFGLVGAVMTYFGLAALGFVPNVFKGLYARHPRAELLIMGALIGLFLVGRPFPLFIKIFRYAAERHDPFIGALAFSLQSIGNIVFMILFFGLIALVTRGRFHNWLTASPGRASAFKATAFLAAGVFMLVYWDLRLPAHFGYGWFPTMPWN